MKRIVCGFLAILTIVGSGFLFIPRVKAASLIVNTTNDSSDAVPGDGTCEVTPGDNDCGLRAALEESNALGGTNSISFNIPGAGVHTFTPSSEYPTVISTLTIDGSTQPGSSCNTLVPNNLPGSTIPHNLMIEIDGTNATTLFNPGLLTFSGTDGSIIRGLVLNNANQSDGMGVFLSDSTNNTTIDCNYIGLGTDGQTPRSNTTGIYSAYNNDGVIIRRNVLNNNQNGANINLGGTNNVLIENNIIGANADGETTTSGSPDLISSITINGSSGASIIHNIISGNAGTSSDPGTSGLNLTEVSTVIVRGNFIGLSAKGNPLGNTGTGLTLYGISGANIGGTSLADRNVISANSGDGIHAYRDCNVGGVSSGVKMFNNYVGVKADGTVGPSYGNGLAGIEVNELAGGCASVYKYQIGGNNSGESNIIAGNGQQGVLVHQDDSNDVFSISILKNSIFDNGALGIDLAQDSDSFSGIADIDLGANTNSNSPILYPTTTANNYLNFPSINNVSSVGNQITVNYNYQAQPVTASDDGYSLLPSNVVGYQLDFYRNDTSDPSGHGQGMTHLGSFIVDGSETNASHTFTSPVVIPDTQYVSATATIIWQNLPGPPSCSTDSQYGDGPPYQQCP
jgi:hypothetical protein